MEEFKQEFINVAYSEFGIKAMESINFEQAFAILDKMQQLRLDVVSGRVCFSSDCFYHDKTTDTCVGDYAKCSFKQTHR